jgi:hypothetical protein
MLFTHRPQLPIVELPRRKVALCHLLGFCRDAAGWLRQIRALNPGNSRIDVFDQQGTQMPSIVLKHKSAH